MGCSGRRATAIPDLWLVSLSPPSGIPCAAWVHPSLLTPAHLSLLKLVSDFRRAHSLPWFQDIVSLHTTNERVSNSKRGSQMCEGQKAWWPARPALSSSTPNAAP